MAGYSEPLRKAWGGVSAKLSLQEGSAQAEFVGHIWDNYDLWSTDMLSFEELLRRLRDHALAKKLVTNVT